MILSFKFKGVKLKKFTFVIIALFVFTTILSALDIPKVGVFQIKKVENKKVLYVVHKKEQGHVTNSLIKLIQFYLQEDIEDYKVVFPQMTLYRYNIEGEYFAIEFNGNPKITNDVKIETLKEGTFATYIYKGSYREIGKEIRDTFKRVLQTREYIPSSKEEIRLLYWNSIDDHHPNELITEIQIRVQKKY